MPKFQRLGQYYKRKNFSINLSSVFKLTFFHRKIIHFLFAKLHMISKDLNQNSQCRRLEISLTTFCVSSLKFLIKQRRKRKEKIK